MQTSWSSPLAVTGWTPGTRELPCAAIETPRYTLFGALPDSANDIAAVTEQLRSVS